jgi:cell division protein FtsW
LEKANEQRKSSFGLFNIRVGEIDVVFMILVFVLLIIGLLALFSASYAFAFYNLGSSYHFISRQIGFAALGVVVMLLLSTVNYKLLYPLAWPIMVATFALLIIVLFFPPINDARRWINLGFTTLQPSEVAKFAVVVLFAHFSVRKGEAMGTFKHGLLPCTIVLGIILVLMFQQPHLSGMILIILLGAVMMLVGGIDLKWFLLAGIVAVAGVAIIMMTDAISYIDARLISWRNPESDPRGVGFQILQSLYAIGSGGLMGVGVGASRQKFLYLPEPQNDFIFAIVAEEIGFVGSVLIILLFALLVWRGFVIALRCKDRFGSLMAIGFTSQVGLQTILNIMVVTNTVPNTGISLPFFSYGGTALLMLLGQMGLVLSISRQSTMEKK